MKLSTFVLAAALGLLCGCSCPFQKAEEPTAKQFTVRNVYGSHMVLQREKPIRIAGTAEAGSTVKVVLAPEAKGAVKSEVVFAKADEKGAWCAELPAKKAGGPYRVTVTGAQGSKSIEFTDVLMGDVWFCSGQSNMEMPVWGPRKLYREEDGDKIAKAANDPQLRLFKVKREVVFAGPLADLANPGLWQTATTAKAVEPFSATGYFFGVALRKELGVPIGLIDSSWGGTMIQPWITKEAYVKAKRSEVAVIEENAKSNIDEYRKKQQAAIKASTLKFQEWVAEADKQAAPQFARHAKEWTGISVPAKGWRKVKGDGLFIVNHLGAGWFRAEFELPAGFDTSEVTLRIGMIDDCDDAYVNGIKVGSTDTKTPNYWMVQRNYKIPTGILKAGRNVIAIRVFNNNGTGGIDGEVVLRGKKVLDLRSKAKWSYRRGFVADKKLCASHPNKGSMAGQQNPTVLYNAMVAPFTAFPIKGVIWYQGCSNANQAADYVKLQKLWISGWREAWGQKDLPFVITQLSGYIKGRPHPYTREELAARQPAQNPGYAPLRDSQKKMLGRKVGVAVTIDLGNAADIHPHNKKEFAPRLLAEALRVAYGRKGVSYGPMFASLKREGNLLRVNFRKSASPLITKDGKAPQSFAVIGLNAKGETARVWAKAKIEKNSVVLAYPGITEPKFVLYAWEDYPQYLNLYNKAGFPAFPFRAKVPVKK